MTTRIVRVARRARAAAARRNATQTPQPLHAARPFLACPHHLHPPLNTRVYQVADTFSRHGRLLDCWVARKPGGFAFVTFESLRDAEDAVRDLDGRGGWKVEISNSRGRRAPPGGGYGGGGGGYGRGGYGPPSGYDRGGYDRGGYGGGGYGGGGGGYDRYRDRRDDRRRSRSRSRDRRRSRSRDRRRRSRSRDRSGSRDRRRRSPSPARDERRRSPSRSPARPRSGSVSPPRDGEPPRGGSAEQQQERGRSRSRSRSPRERTRSASR